MQDRDPNGAGLEDDDDEESGLDLDVVRDYLGYAFRAVRLHPLLAAVVSVGIISATYFAVRSLPKSYHIESKLLANKDTTLGRGNPFGADPLKGVTDIVMGHDQLASLVKQLELATWWREHLAPAQRLKASVMGLLGKKPDEEEQVRILIEILGTKMYVNAGEATVTFALDWPNGEMGARIVDTAEQNFLEKRHVLEISTIAESVSILEEHAAKVRREIEELTQAERAAMPEKPAKGDGPTPRASGPVVAGAVGVRRAPHRRPEIDAELARQKVMIETKQRAIADLEEFRQRRVQELQASLAEQRSRYTDAHPVIVGIQQNIASISRESPQVATLRSEVKALQEAYDRMRTESDGPEAGGGGGGAGPALPSPGPGAAAVPSDIASLLIAPHEDRDPAMEAQISYAVAKYSEIRAQISSARIDLDLAQAAFRYRYTVVVPAEPPRAPSKPKVPVIMGGAAVAALLLGVLAAVAAELRSGRLVNRWQVERYLKLPVLAELQLPRAGRPEDPS
jgi:hypothetical protein